MPYSHWYHYPDYDVVVYHGPNWPLTWSMWIVPGSNRE